MRLAWIQLNCLQQQHALPGALQEVRSAGSQDSNREHHVALHSSATTSFLRCRCNAPLQTMVAGIPKGGLGTASYAASKSSMRSRKMQGMTTSASNSHKTGFYVTPKGPLSLKKSLPCKGTPQHLNKCPTRPPDSAGSKHGQHAHLASAARKCNPAHRSANVEMNHDVQVSQLTGVCAAPTSALSASSRKTRPPAPLC